MAVIQGQKASWENIADLYTKLNAERTRFNIAKVTIPEEEESLALAQDLNDLKNLIIAMRSNSYINSSMGTTIENLSDATKGALLKVNVFNDKEEMLNRISQVCPHDGTFATNRSNYTTNYGYDSSDYVCSFDFQQKTSNDGYNTHNYSFTRSGCEGDKSYRGRGGG